MISTMNPLIPTYQHLFDSQLSDMDIMTNLRANRKRVNSPLQKEKITHQMRILNGLIIERSIHLRAVDEIIFYSGFKTIKEATII